jgi:hypothetical protein
MLPSQPVDPLDKLLAGRFRWNIHPGSQENSTGLDEHSNDGFLGMEPDEVRDDGQKLVGPTHPEPRLRLLAAAPSRIFAS